MSKLEDMAKNFNEIAKGITYSAKEYAGNGNDLDLDCNPKKRGKKKSKLESLVPPLELCKLIPAGEFGDSCYVWVPRSNGEDYQLFKRTAFIESAHKCYPAPTLEEIMVAMPYCQIYRRKNGSFVGCYATRWDQKVSGETGSTAALKMWLKLKGVEV